MIKTSETKHVFTEIFTFDEKTTTRNKAGFSTSSAKKDVVTTFEG